MFITKGNLSKKYPNRIKRLAHCRNIYVTYIRKNIKKQKWQFIVVADVDGMNFNLSQKKIKSCFDTELDWDGLMANQKYGYYDIYALRANAWVEMDCFIEINEHKDLSIPPNHIRNPILNFANKFAYEDKFRRSFIYNKMRIIKSKEEFIKVDSAFGGFAIYKPQVFFDSLYKSTHGLESEHVYFHMRLKTKKYNFYINPALTNNKFNSYNINKFFVVRLARQLKKSINASISTMKCF